MHQIRFWLGLRLSPRWGSLQRSPGSLAGFKGPTSKGKEEREGEIMEGEVRLHHSKFLDPPLYIWYRSPPSPISRRQLGHCGGPLNTRQNISYGQLFKRKLKTFSLRQLNDHGVLWLLIRSLEILLLTDWLANIRYLALKWKVLKKVF